MMNTMLQEHARLYEIVGGKMKSRKSGFFSWQLFLNNGRKILQKIEKDIRVREEIMKQYSNEESVRALGICVSPMLNWDRKFQEVKIKIEESIRNLSNNLMASQFKHLHINSYFISKNYFGCGIMDVTDSQDKKLRRMHENPLARKLGSGSNFPRKMLHGRVKTIGFVIMAPKTAITSLTRKLCLCHKIMNSENEKNAENNRK